MGSERNGVCFRQLHAAAASSLVCSVNVEQIILLEFVPVRGRLSSMVLDGVLLPSMDRISTNQTHTHTYNACCSCKCWALILVLVSIQSLTLEERETQANKRGNGFQRPKPDWERWECKKKHRWEGKIERKSEQNTLLIIAQKDIVRFKQAPCQAEISYKLSTSNNREYMDLKPRGSESSR